MFLLCNIFIIYSVISADNQTYFADFLYYVHGYVCFFLAFVFSENDLLDENVYFVLSHSVFSCEN